MLPAFSMMSTSEPQSLKQQFGRSSCRRMKAIFVQVIRLPYFPAVLTNSVIATSRKTFAQKTDRNTMFPHWWTRLQGSPNLQKPSGSEKSTQILLDLGTLCSRTGT